MKLKREVEDDGRSFEKGVAVGSVELASSFAGVHQVQPLRAFKSLSF
jgi:hypothetical protein